MTPQTALKIEALEEEIEELQRQKYLIQSQYDFADFIETHNLIDQEIERIRHEIREERKRFGDSEELECEEGIDEVEEEEEEEVESYVFPKRYTIEHVIRDSDGRIRPLRLDDLSIDRNRGVREAFKMIYEFQKRGGKHSISEKREYVGKQQPSYKKMF